MSTQLSVPTHAFISDLVEQHAARHGDSVAVVCEGRELSYGALNARANQLARLLVRLAVRPGELVGVCLERSPESIISILAVLKARGAFVYLDPRYPRERLNYMLADSAMRALITTRGHTSDLDTRGVSLLDLEVSDGTVTDMASHNLDKPLDPSDLAYVMYTSGSSGTPKGVAITIANLSAYVPALNEHLQISDRDTYLHTASFSFSSSVRQLVLPLSQCAKLVIATSWEIRDPCKLFQLIKRAGVTVIDIIPSYWRSSINMLRALPEPERRDVLDNQLRLVASASEPLPPEVPETWVRELGFHGRLLNMYGQTETTGIVSVFPIPEHYSVAGRSVSIGKPIQNATMYLLDGNLRPVPEGEPGEIFIGGSGLGRGYLGRSDLTARTFIQSPFEPQERLYRTGDLARAGPDGNIEHLGRVDQQVKIRGCRVEVGEVESALARLEGIQESAVSAQRDRESGTRLVGYVVLKDGQPTSAAGIRQGVSRILPDYMVPAEIVVLRNMPRTPNGKVDRKRLPHATVRVNADGKRMQPRTDLERRLSTLWKQVLGVKSVGVRDGFFELGGDSLAAVELFVLILDEFGMRCPPDVLFATPTIEALASRIVQDTKADAMGAKAIRFKHLVRMSTNAGAGRRPVFLVHGAHGNVVNLWPLAKRIGRRHRVYAFQARGLAETEEPCEDLEEMAAAYTAEIRAVQASGPYVVGGFCAGGNVSLEIARQLRSQGQDVDLVVLIDAFSNSVPDQLTVADKLKIHTQELRARGVRDVFEWMKRRTIWELRRVREYFDMRRSKLTPAEDRGHAIHSAYRRANAAYTQRPYAGKVVLFRPKLRESHLLGPGRSVNRDREFVYADNGWGRFIKGLDVHEISGDHDSQVLEPAVAVLAGKFQSYLNKLTEAEQRPGPEECHGVNSQRNVLP